MALQNEAVIIVVYSTLIVYIQQHVDIHWLSFTVHLQLPMGPSMDLGLCYELSQLSMGLR
jgi:hypothetical protein